VHAIERLLGVGVHAALVVGWACSPSPRLVPPGSAAAQREDLAAFRREFFEVDRSYSPQARAEASARLSALASELGKVSDARFVLTLSQIAALADNGHTGVVYRGGSDELGRVGIRLVPFGTDFVVVQALEAYAPLLGGRLVAIDGTPVARLREAARTLCGGTAPHRDRMAPLLFESPGQLYALGLAHAPNEARYAVRTPDGATREALLAVVSPPAGDLDETAELLSPDTAPAGWRPLLASGRAPWTLQEPDETLRWRDLPELDAVEIQLRANFDGARPIAAFLDEAEAEGRRVGRRNVVLDMRANGGGDLTLTHEWMSGLPSRLRPGGRVVVLTSPWTFSAAISGVGYLKQAGRARVVLVGEAPGDRLRFWAEGRPIRLPHSGALVLMATEQHDYLTGCAGFRDCHRHVVDHPIAVETLEPEVEAPWTLESYVAGRDPGMEAAARVLSIPASGGSGSGR